MDCQSSGPPNPVADAFQAETIAGNKKNSHPYGGILSLLSFSSVRTTIARWHSHRRIIEMTSNNRTAILAVVGCALSLLAQAAWAQTASEVAKLLASDGANTDYFGISISMDGDTAVIGAPRDGDNGTLSGSAYVFTRSGSTWTQQAKLVASDGASGDFFGQSVSIDGDTAVVGAWLDDATGSDSGSAWLFTGI